MLSSCHRSHNYQKITSVYLKNAVGGNLRATGTLYTYLTNQRTIFYRKWNTCLEWTSGLLLLKHVTSYTLIFIGNTDSSVIQNTKKLNRILKKKGIYPRWALNWWKPDYNMTYQWYNTDTILVTKFYKNRLMKQIIICSLTATTNVLNS